MKHIRKIVSIATALKEKFDYSTDEISCIIAQMSLFEDNLRKLNEQIASLIEIKTHSVTESLRLSLYRKERVKKQEEISKYIQSMFENNEYVFSNSPADIPIKINLGLKYANHSDDVSFVINL